MRTRPTLPVGNGELSLQPDFSAWGGLLQSNRQARGTWTFEVGGMSATDFVAAVRAESLQLAAGFSARLGVAVAVPGDSVDPIVATGHQPELYHPGVWIKDFLLERVATEVGATAIDVVVDTDGFESVSLTSPCLTPGISRCRQYLALGTAEGTYLTASVPDVDVIERFAGAVEEALRSLPAPAILTHFARFAAVLRDASLDATSLGELMTFARRRFEAQAGTDYLEVPVSSISRSETFARFVVDIALDARRFLDEYNSQLEEYRRLTSTRSPAQPFPNLAVAGDRVELPFWAITGAGRESVWAEAGAGGVRLFADDDVVVDLPSDPGIAVSTLLSVDTLFAPKAVTLTMFVRMFASDLFIHGIGGGRYDQVTDGVIRRYYGVEPPAFVVASMTIFLPLGAHAVTPEEIAQAKERLNRLVHNPDALLGEVEFDSADERDRAVALAGEKQGLVSGIAKPDADKKELGARIRAINTELATMLAPVKAELEERLALLEGQAQADDVLTDRTYPYCFWDPREIADKAG